MGNGAAYTYIYLTPKKFGRMYICVYISGDVILKKIYCTVYLIIFEYNYTEYLWQYAIYQIDRQVCHRISFRSVPHGI